MTLGPKFFSCNKMTITRRTKHLRKLFTLRESRRPTWILRHLKTCRHLVNFLNPFYGLWNLRIFLESEAEWVPKAFKTEAKMSPKWYQMGSKIVILEVWVHFWRPGEACSLFLTFVGPILGSIFGVFWSQEAWKNNHNFFKQMQWEKEQIWGEKVAQKGLKTG